jgi:hypothetical protein
MEKFALSLFVTGLFTICSGGPVVYDPTSTGFNVSSYSGASCSAFLDLAGDVLTVNAGNYCRALALLDETVANSEDESEGVSSFGDTLLLSPGGIALTDTESMGVLAVFLLDDSTGVPDIGFVAPDERADADADAAIWKIFSYTTSIPVTIAILMAGTGLILVVRLKRRRGSRRKA